MKKRFAISMDVYAIMTVDEIWPDGDAPENPTCEQVAARIAESGSPMRWLEDWNMVDDTGVSVQCGADLSEVVW